MASKRIRNTGAASAAISMLLLAGCQTTQLVATPVDDPIFVTSKSPIEGTPLSLAEQGGGALVRVNPQGGAWLPERSWRVVSAFADACRRDPKCFTAAATKVYAK